jgi:adenylate cyclase
VDPTKPTRKLATIVAADCVAFSKLMDKNEELTLQNIKICRGLIDPVINEHGGRIFHTAGDSVIAEFSSVVDSVNAAIEFQKILSERNDSVAEDSKMVFRVGIHLDDVIIEGDNIYGSGVNVAARLEGLCEPGCVLLSRTVHEKIVKRIEIAIDNLGNAKLKNIEGEFEIYQISPTLSTPTELAEHNTATVFAAGGEAVRPMGDGAVKPRLMLLPFRNLNKSDENDFLVDGIVDDIITELSMINSIEIMSRNTTFDLKDNVMDVKEAAEKYKLDYVITGSIRSAGNRVRISAELGDPTSGDSIWSERYDRTMDDVFEIQDEIVSKMANTVLSEIDVTSLKRAKRKPTNKMTSYEYLLQGKFHKRKLTKVDANIAVDMFNNAIESDPSNGRAYAERCCTWADGLGHNWFDETDEELHEKIRTTLGNAYELTDHDWDCHRLLCNISMHLDLNYDKAEEHGKRAYELNPNNPTVLASYGKSLVQNDKCKRGVELLRKAQELDPLSQQLIDDLVWGSYALGDFDTCIQFSEKIRKIRPNTWLLKIASFGALKRLDERGGEIDQFIESYGKDELGVQLEKLNFNNSKVSESTRNFILD